MPQVQVRLTEKPEEEIWGREEQSVGVEGRKKKKKLRIPSKLRLRHTFCLKSNTMRHGPHRLDIKEKESYGQKHCPGHHKQGLLGLTDWICLASGWGRKKVTPVGVWTRPFLCANKPVAFGLMNCAF